MKDLLITAFRDIQAKGIIPLQKDGLYHTGDICAANNNWYKAESFLFDTDNYEIFSVKRLTDNVEFHIGDSFIWCEEKILTIDKISYEGGSILLKNSARDKIAYGGNVLFAKKANIKNMRRFELIKRYPNSPELGVVGYVGYKGLKLEDFIMFTDNWKEIEKSFKVLRYADGFSEYYLKKNGMYTVNGKDEYSYADLAHFVNKNLHIKTVRRESDGVNFTLGDKIVSSNNSVCAIERFMISANFSDIKIYSKDSVLTYISLEKAVLVDMLFTTADGVIITEKNFNNYDYFYVGENYGISLICFPMDYDYSRYLNTLFTSKKAADKYIYDHKPVYTEKEYQQALAPKGGDGMFN